MRVADPKAGFPIYGPFLLKGQCSGGRVFCMMEVTFKELHRLRWLNDGGFNISRREIYNDIGADDTGRTCRNG